MAASVELVEGGISHVCTLLTQRLTKLPRTPVVTRYGAICGGSYWDTVVGVCNIYRLLDVLLYNTGIYLDEYTA